MSRAALELKNEIVRAGAGAGKTTRLTMTVLETARRFLELDGRLPRVVVTTFTRKATQELRERLVRKACEMGDERLIEFVSSPSHLHISTIHGVLSMFLRRYGHLLEMDASFSFLDPAASTRLARKILRDEIVTNEIYQGLLEDFTFDELTAMVRAYAEAQPAEGAALTFFNEAALRKLLNERLLRLAGRLEKAAQGVATEASSAPWQDYARHLVQSAQGLAAYATGGGSTESSRAALLADFRGADWLEQLNSEKKPRYTAKTAGFSEALHDELKDALDDCDELESLACDAEALKKFAAQAEIFGELAQGFTIEWRETKLNQGLLDMSDLESFTAAAAARHPEMARTFAAEWDYWLIDEFQDTSPRQVELLRRLVGGKPVFVVGDPQQSIYLFRGARSEVFQNEEAEFRERGDRLSELMTNYRSRPELLLFLNDFFSSLGQGFLPMEPKAPVTDAQHVAAKFQIVAKDTIEPFAPFARDIERAVKAGAQFDHFCILARTNGELKPIARYLESRRIPTHIHSSDGFFARREVLDALTILKFLLNPLDNLNFMRLVRSPWFKISDADLERALGARPAYHWLEVRAKLAQHESLLRLEDWLIRVESLGYFEALRQALIETGLLDTSHFHDATGRRESNLWKLLSILRENEKQPGFSYMTFAQKAFQGFRSIEGDEETDAVAALEPNRVNLMTVHKAKGLKFRHVILPNMGKRLTVSASRGHKSPFVFHERESQFTLALRLGDERKLTHNLAAEDHFSEVSEREREEYLRVLYVALTRAEESVTLHWQDPPSAGSWASMIQWELSGERQQKENYAYTVEREGSEASETKTLDLPLPAGDLKVRPLWDAGAPGSTGLRQKRVSVTRLLEEQENLAEYELSAQRSQISKPADLKHFLETPAFGQKLHMVLERMKYAGDHLDLAGYGERWFGERTEEFFAAVEYITQLEEPPMSELIASGEVEWGFQLATARGVVEGQVDLWGRDASGVVWVIDYKTGTSRYKEKAFDQLALYAHALRKHGVAGADGAGEIRLAVIYALEERCETRVAPSSAETKSKFGI